MPETAARPLRVFLCHSSGDKPTVRELYQKLSAESWLDVWLDEEKLLPGQDWDYEIEKALDDSDAVIVTLSTGSVTKEGYVQKELKYVLDMALEKPEGTIFILPVRLVDCERPRKLRPIHGVDYFPPERREWAYTQLRRSLESRANALSITTNTVKSKSEPLPYAAQEKKPEPKPIAETPKVETKRETLTSAIEKPIQTSKIRSAEPELRTLGDIEFVKVPKGMFLMGSNGDKYQPADRDEKPQHTVNLPYDYYIARTPITNEQYSAYVRAKRIRHPVSSWEEKRDHPVVNVSWKDAMSYCQWLNSLRRNELPSSVVLRLPTEAEWERAARGTDGLIFPWGNTFDKDVCNTIEGGINDTTSVGVYSPQGDSPYGAADMAGNVWEWTHSSFEDYPYKADDGREEEEKLSEVYVLRGGSFVYKLQGARAMSRNGDGPDSIQPDWGFRVVVASYLS